MADFENLASDYLWALARDFSKMMYDIAACEPFAEDGSTTRIREACFNLMKSITEAYDNSSDIERCAHMTEAAVAICDLAHFMALAEYLVDDQKDDVDDARTVLNALWEEFNQNVSSYYSRSVA